MREEDSIYEAYYGDEEDGIIKYSYETKSGKLIIYGISDSIPDRTILDKVKIMSIIVDEDYPTAENTYDIFANIADVLPTMRNLTVLHIKGCSYTDIVKIAKILPNVPHLTTLYLHENLIGNKGLKVLATEFTSMTKLNELIITCSNNSSKGAKALAKAIPYMTGITRLVLYSAKIGQAGAIAIANGLKELPVDRTVSIIVDAANALDFSAFDDRRTFIDLIHKNLNINPLTILNLESNRISNKGAIAIASALPHLTQLTDLDLCRNNIRDTGAIAIAKSLPHLTQLTDLNLCNNKIGDIGAEAIAKALPKMTKLSLLNISSNKIGDIGAEAIAKALPKR
jgi:Ran GTPase-activating protein (RanGAP) involved in mRNA processing and transport